MIIREAHLPQYVNEAMGDFLGMGDRYRLAHETAIEGRGDSVDWPWYGAGDGDGRRNLPRCLRSGLFPSIDDGAKSWFSQDFQSYCLPEKQVLTLVADPGCLDVVAADQHACLGLDICMR